MGSIQGTIVTWSFVGGNGSDVEESNVPMHVDPIIDGQDNFPANARDVFRQAFDDWQRVADITFVELTDGSDGDIRVGAHHFDDTALGHGFFPGEHPIAGDVHMRIDDDEWTAESLRAVGMHEIGHGIGLHHILSGGSGEIMHSSHSGNEINATSQDITYLQSIYGPPLPIIESIEIADDSGRSLVLRVNWSYPTEPLTPATFTRLHDGQVDVDGINRVAQVTVAAGDLHELLLFDLRHTPLQFQTITDGGEDNETAFDDVTPGLGGSLSWERTGFRVKTGSKAYRVDFDLVEFSGDFQLPQLVPVRATDTTVFRFQRAFFFTASQKIRYFVAVDDGEPILLQEETGSNNSNQADSPFTLREYDLSAHAGSNILVGFEYHNASAFENADNGVSIDDIELTDVFSATGTPVVLSNTIPATALPLPPTAAASP
ncbi:MAG: matrixin family metalloprotease, partial [Lentisphaeria bacterium]|nr:matrixin family metalloprotease [Lentisphaeria bacterium]